MSNTNTSNGTKKRQYVIIFTLIAALIIVGVGGFWFKGQFNTDVVNTIQETKEQVNQTRQVVNETRLELNETRQQVNTTSEAVNISLENQKVIAKGLNELGNIIIGDVKSIKNQTSLIDDIKFDTEQILNTNLSNITLG